ncbi:MAG: M20/M25/M40 family metallo-hydrolase [Planctomycetota bacterium]
MSRKILTDLLSLPTAPFAEHVVIDHILAFCRRRSLSQVKQDRAGNILVRVRQKNRKVRRPVCITAHLDHPGFIADKMTGSNRLRAFWRGGVPKEYFVSSKVRFFVDGKWVKGFIRSVKTRESAGVKRVDTATIEVKSAVPPSAIGMWDLPDPGIRNGRIYARACDDLAGAAAMLCAIDRIVRTGVACDAYFLFTRAEEVGFVGAIAASKRKTIPQECVVVAMETSSELVDAKMGNGPILRVGDRASTFTPQATAYCHRIARQLAASDRSFKFQRKLMDGGTCESSAYCTLGYEATGMCLALGNYHNCNRRTRKIGPEYVNLEDFNNVVKWFVELARAPLAYTGKDENLTRQVTDLEKTYRRLLQATVKQPG